MQIAPNVREQTSIIADPNTLLLHRHVAPFRSEVGKKTSGVETRGQISPFLTPCKFRGGIGEIAEWEARVRPTAKPPEYI